MNKYIYCECTTECWPKIKTIMAKSYNDAVEKLINNYLVQFDDDHIAEISDFLELRDYLNEQYNVALSDLEIYEEI